MENRGSFNEDISVEDDEYSLFRKTLGMMIHVDQSDQRMTAEDAARFLWKVFIKR